MPIFKGHNTIRPLHTLYREEVVFAKMASVSFLRTEALDHIENARYDIESSTDYMLSKAQPLDYLPGFVSASDVLMRITSIFEEKSGMAVGGVAGGTVWTHPDFRGRGIGSEALIKAFETGVKLQKELVFFSPQGYANRSAAHRKAVFRARDNGFLANKEILAPYQASISTSSRPEQTGVRVVDDDMDNIAEDSIGIELNESFGIQDWPVLALASNTPVLARVLPKLQKWSLDSVASSDLLRQWQARLDSGQLKVSSASYNDPISFAEAEVGNVDPTGCIWKITDSVGQVVESRCNQEKASFYLDIREFNLVELKPSPREIEHHRARGELYARSIELWETWEQSLSRGMMPVDMIIDASSKQLDMARMALLVSRAVGANQARFCSPYNAPPWSHDLTGAGWEIDGPRGSLYISISTRIGSPALLFVHSLIASPGSENFLARDAFLAMRETVVSRGVEIHLPLKGAMNPEDIENIEGLEYDKSRKSWICSPRQAVPGKHLI